MKTTRNTPTAFRFDPAVKDALAAIADRDGRSMANMLEWLIRKHCEREGLGWPPVQASAGGAEPAAMAVAPTKPKNKTAKTATSKNSKSENKQA